MEFSYYMPVRVISGADCVLRNANVFDPFGKRALIVTGKSSEKNGALSDVACVMHQLGKTYKVFDGISSNPSAQSVREGAALARSFGADFVVALGGGSPMDAAKAIAMLARQDAEDIFSHSISEDVLPMIHIPTTAGTGSEVTQYSVLTNDRQKTKMSISAPFLFPKIAFLDGKYMRDLPQSVTVNTAIDAISHAVEGMLSVRANPITDALAKEALKILMGEYASLSSGKYSAESRQNLLVGASVAGMVIAGTGTTPVHGMGYSLTYFRNIPHGRANGLLLPAFLHKCAEKIPAIISNISAALGMGIADFSKKISALLGEKEHFTDTELHDYAHRAAQNRNIHNCAAFFNEKELYNVLQEAIGNHG